MKQILLLITLLLPICALPSNYPWKGNTDMFLIDASGRLNFTSPQGEAGEASLSIPLVYSDDMTWEADVCLDFKSSNANNARIVVYSDDDIFYYIQVGNNSGQVSFYVKDGFRDAKQCIKGRKGLANNSTVSIRLKLSDGNTWTMFTRAANEATYYDEGSYTMRYQPYDPQTFIQIICRYVKSRVSHYSFDHIRLSNNTAEPSEPSTEAPIAELMDVEQSKPNVLRFLFSAPVDIFAASCYVEGIGEAERIAYGDNKSMIDVHFAQPFVNGQTYYLEWTDLYDGTNAAPLDLVLELLFEDDDVESPVEPPVKPEEVVPDVNPGDVIFNELLPNPYLGGSEYIELYNRSGRRLSLDGLAISVRKGDGSLSTVYPLSDILIEEEGYALLSKDIEAVSSFYYAPDIEVMHEMKLPILSNTSATLVLYGIQNGEVIDEVSYSSKWHASSVRDPKGVALERINPESPSKDASNWTSATAMAGNGTPGYQNSQYGMENGTITHIEPPVWAPDGTYRISYQLNATGYNCRADIYALSGKKVATVAAHELLSVAGELVWNGQGADGKSLPAGVYIIYMEIYNSNGETIRYKKPFLVR